MLVSSNSRRILLLSLVSRESVGVRERNDQTVLNSTRVIHMLLFWYVIGLVFREDFGAVLMFRVVSYTSDIRHNKTSDKTSSCERTLSNTSYDTGMLRGLVNIKKI